MKRIINFILMLAILFGLVACGSTTSVEIEETTAPKAVFMAGFGKTDITPEEPVPMQGYADDRTRISTGLVTYLDAVCVAIQDINGDIMLFMVGDTSWATSVVAKPTIEQIGVELGIPADHIVISGTHTHNSVSPAVTDNPAIAKYNKRYVSQMVEAARLAIEDLKPAELYVGSAKTDRLNFVRRYYMDDGSLIGDGTYGTGTKIVEHESEADNEAQLLKFVREDAKDILIVNFQAHPHLEGKTNSISAQNAGQIRWEIEDQLDVHCLYWQGASGNLNSSSRISEEMRTKDRKEYAKLFVDHVKEVYSDLTPVESGLISVKTVEVTAEVNHSLDDKLLDANEVVQFLKDGNSIEEANTFAQSKGFNTYYHASRAVSNAILPATKSLSLTAFSFGGISGIVVPYEMFDTNGMYIKENTPFEKTFIISYAYPAYGGYIPSALAFENGGYEIDNGTYVAGTAELLADAYLELLNDLAK